ncbi:MAG: hypothetical protein GDA67_08340 [Nitrospira sp. CR1.3]|nr:hypothetical protein [Nitrospira sp. CR1.3]
MQALLPALGALQHQTDDWFRRASAAALGQLPCRAGCSHCCIGPFAITVLDVHALQEGLKQLSDSERGEIQERAIGQTAEMEAAYPQLKQTPFLDHWAEVEIDRLVNQFHTAPCPALGENGLCRLYDNRPLTCRSMGLPIEEGSLTQGACSVQTFVPIRRLSAAFKDEEQCLAGKEATVLNRFRMTGRIEGEEVLLPYGFLPDAPDRTLVSRT